LRIVVVEPMRPFKASPSTFVTIRDGIVIVASSPPIRNASSPTLWLATIAPTAPAFCAFLT
jgi:hypothetical protein